MSPRVPYRIATTLTVAYILWVGGSLIAQRNAVALPFRIGEAGEFLIVLSAVSAFVWGLAVGELKGRNLTAWQVLDENLERYAMLIAYVFVCVVIVQEVVRRFLLNYSSAWSQETAQYLFIYLGYVGTAYAVKERAHIRFDILINRVGPSAKALLYIFAELCTLLFAAITMYWSMHTVLQLWHFGGTTPVLRVNKSWFELAVPIGFALTALRCIQAIVRDLADLRSGRPAFVGKTMFEE